MQLQLLPPVILHLPLYNALCLCLSLFVVLLVLSAAVPAGVDLPGERPGDGEAPRAAGGGHGAPLQLPRRLHPGGQKHQPLH